MVHPCLTKRPESLGDVQFGHLPLLLCWMQSKWNWRKKVIQWLTTMLKQCPSKSFKSWCSDLKKPALMSYLQCCWRTPEPWSFVLNMCSWECLSAQHSCCGQGISLCKFMDVWWTHTLSQMFWIAHIRGGRYWRRLSQPSAVLHSLL